MSQPDSSSNPSEIQVWGFEGLDVRIHDRDGNAWFVTTDIGVAWDIKNIRQVVATLDDDEKATVCITDSGGRPYKLQIISESGLYALAAKSRKEAPKRFCKWVRSEVVPTLRKTGTYTMPGAQPPADGLVIAQAVVAGMQPVLKAIVERQNAMETKLSERQDAFMAQYLEFFGRIEGVFSEHNTRLTNLEANAPIPGYMTLAGFSSLKGIRVSKEEMGFWGKRLGTHCRTHGVERVPVPDQRYGKVYSYPLTVLEATFPTLGPR